MWILSFGEDAEVLKPEALRTRIAARATALRALYEQPEQLRLL
jgi:predicted DNA-binding transcriptional regulator YafY